MTLAYDPLGRLWQIASASGTTRFIYDPGSGSGAGSDALIWETDGAGNPLRAYAHGPNAAADDPLIWYDGAAGFARRFVDCGSASPRPGALTRACPAPKLRPR